MLNSKALEQITAEGLCWRSRWNQLASTTSCFGCSACLQSLSSVLCRTAYSLESPQDRLGGTHAEGAGHPDSSRVALALCLQVEHTADCFGGAWFKSPLSTEVWHPRHIWRQTAFQFAEELGLNGKTYVVSVNEFLATCNWQVVGAQVEQNWCKDRALMKAVMLGSPRTGVIAHVHPETTISKQQTHQSGEPIWHAFTQFV